jgi:hypothetical protein
MQEIIHTYDQPHWFHQPTEGISWNVPGEKIRLNISKNLKIVNRRATLSKMVNIF